MSSKILQFEWKKHYRNVDSNSRNALRFDDVAFAVAFVGINNPTPAISGNGAAIAL